MTWILTNATFFKLPAFWSSDLGLRGLWFQGPVTGVDAVSLIVRHEHDLFVFKSGPDIVIPRWQWRRWGWDCFASSQKRFDKKSICGTESILSAKRVSTFLWCRQQIVLNQKTILNYCHNKGRVLLSWEVPQLLQSWLGENISQVFTLLYIIPSSCSFALLCIS